jgi:hypothetical protein
MRWPEFDGYGYTASIIHPDERNGFHTIQEDYAAGVLRAPRLIKLVKLGEWFEHIDHMALMSEQWLCHRVRIRLFCSYHRGDHVLLHMRELEWKETVFANEANLPHISVGPRCDDHFWSMPRLSKVLEWIARFWLQSIEQWARKRMVRAEKGAGAS